MRFYESEILNIKDNCILKDEIQIEIFINERGTSAILASSKWLGLVLHKVDISGFKQITFTLELKAESEITASLTTL